MPATYYLANALVAHQLGKTSYTMPTVYVGFSSTTPTLAGGSITEPTTGGYARVATTGATWGVPSSGSAMNVAVITFPVATAAWVAGAALTHLVFFDSSTGGNCLAYQALAVTRTCLLGDQIVLAVGDVTLTIT